MAQTNLPSDLRGNWVWEERARNHVESYLLFRREFTLDEIPSSADLWLAVRSFFHLYINGTHVSYGLATCPVRGSYAWYFDVAYLLGTGVNTIAILAHNTRVSRSSCHRQPSGMWCQLNVDGRPQVWTDTSWNMIEAPGFLRNRPRRSIASGFTERLDLRRQPKGWEDRDFSTDDWGAPDYCSSISTEHWELLPFPVAEMSVQAQPLQTIEARGTWGPAFASTSLSFEKLVAQNGPGVYGAETYIHSATDTDVDIELYSDNPYRLFVNQACIKEQAVEPLRVGAAFQSSRSLCFRQGETANPAGSMKLRTGWNQISIFQQLEPDATGLTLIFPGIEHDGVKIHRDPKNDSMPGWSLAGPLRTPLASMLGNVTLMLASERENYIPVDSSAIDEGAELMSFDLNGSDEGAQPLEAEESIELRDGEYVVLALNASTFGCPEFNVTGTEGDVLTIVCGTDLVDNQLLPYEDGRQNVDAVVLAGEQRTWMACAPRGLRYLMILGRHIQDVVNITAPVVKIRRFQTANPGAFECSDDMLNEIWRVGKRTLDASVQEAFLDSPCKEETQYIADAMIESWASYHVYGNFGLAAKSLEEFAVAQFETGEMPAACPSDIYFNIPDYALLWPVWLQRHYLYTGDRQLVERLLPHAKMLFSYFDHVSIPGRDVLGDLSKYGGYCFLDHSEIDRQGIITGLNALYCRGLLSGAYLLEAAGETEEAGALREQADRVARQIRDLTWDAERGLFADSWHDGERSEHFSPVTNVLAIYGGMARSSDYPAIFDRLFTDEPPFEKSPVGPMDNPYFKYFVMETAFALGRREWALRFLRWYWGGMVEKGAKTWWELHDPQSDDAVMPLDSACHGYGTSPNAYLISEVAGIRPAKPGFSTAFFNPCTNLVDSLKARIPTPYGEILVEWEVTDEGQLEAVIDASYPLAVIPELEPGLAESATIHVSDEVTIYASEAVE